MKNYDAYLFDWDGTIADSFSMWLSIVRRTVLEYGQNMDDKQLVRKIFGRAKPGLLELGVPEQDLPAIFAGWDKQAHQGVVTIPLYNQAFEMLHALKSRGKKLGLITSTIRSTLEKTIAVHKLQGIFDVVVPGNEAKEKPHPEGVLLALQQLGVRKEAAIMIGDSEKDLQAAKNAGVDSMLFYPPEHEVFHNLSELMGEKPVYVINSWKEFIEQLQ